jgi:hypothetical protein
VFQLARKTGWAITYEDPAWLDPADRIELPKPGRSGKSLVKAYGLRDGVIDVDIPLRASLSLDEQKRFAVQDILTYAESRLLPGRFSVQSRGGIYHVVPIAANDATGQLRPYSSPLDVRISMPLFKGNGIDAFVAITAAISKASHRILRPGTIPLNILGQANVSISADQELARDLVLRFLKSVGTEMSWRLLCQPGVETCGFNLYVVGKK